MVGGDRQSATETMGFLREKNEIESYGKSFSVSFLDSLLDDIVITDKKGEIIHVCPAFEKFWGVKPEEFI